MTPPHPPAGSLASSNVEMTPPHPPAGSLASSNGPKSGWAIGIQGGSMHPISLEEGFFRGLNTIQVKTKDGPRPMLSTADILSTESGSTMGITALAYSTTPCHQLLRMDRIVVDHNPKAADKYPVPQYTIPGEIDGLSLYDVPETAMSYAQTNEGLSDIIEHYAAPSLACKIPCLLSAICLPRGTFVDGDTNIMFGSIMNGVLSLMGVDPSKRTASNDEAVKHAVDNSGGSLQENDFVTVRTLDGKLDGPLPPLPYINFALLGPANGGSSNYKNLMLNRGSNYENLMLDLDKAYSGTLLETFEDGYIVYGSKPNSDVLKKLRYENYEGVTKFHFTATPDSVESMYRAGSVPSQNKCGGWKELRFSPFNVPTVDFNKGQFSILQSVKAGTDFLPGGFVNHMVTALAKKLWLLKPFAPCITNNVTNSVMMSFYGWPDGDQSKSPTKMLFHDSGYFMPPSIAPLLARGYSKIMRYNVAGGPLAVVKQILIIFGLCINHSPEGVVESTKGVPPTNPGAFGTLFEAGNDLMDVSEEIRDRFRLNIKKIDGSTKPIRKLPKIAVLALEDIYKQIDDITESGDAGVYVLPSNNYKNKYELKVASNDYHGLPAYPNQKATIMIFDSSISNNWKSKCNVQRQSLSPITGKAASQGFLPADHVNYNGDFACWSVLSQRKKIAKFLDLQIIE